jgi:flagellar biosynthesis/type III secretory pathway protein FliH
LSPSAKRLAPSVSTGRFAWQATATAEVRPAPLFEATPPGPVAVTPAMRDLPSPSAERVHAIEREAFSKGYGQGERAGEKAAAAKTEAMLQRLSATIDEIGSLRTGVMRRAERELVRLALAMAERILCREIDADRELLLVMARVAVERLGENAVATIHLNPYDFEAAIARREPDPGKAVEIIADANIPRGGCLVKSAFGTIDASINSQIRELSRALLGADTGEEQEALDADVGHS